MKLAFASSCPDAAVFARPRDDYAPERQRRTRARGSTTEDRGSVNQEWVDDAANEKQWRAFRRLAVEVRGAVATEEDCDDGSRPGWQLHAHAAAAHACGLSGWLFRSSGRVRPSRPARRTVLEKNDTFKTLVSRHLRNLTRGRHGRISSASWPSALKNGWLAAQLRRRDVLGQRAAGLSLTRPGAVGGGGQQAVGADLRRNAADECAFAHAENNDAALKQLPTRSLRLTQRQ